MTLVGFLILALIAVVYLTGVSVLAYGVGQLWLDVTGGED